jgi:hypothetical protein
MTDGSTLVCSVRGGVGRATRWATQVNITFESDKARLHRFRLPLILTAIATAIAFVFAHFELSGARIVFALANMTVFTIGAALTALSIVCIVRHRRWSFIFDLSLGIVSVVFMIAWLIPIYVYGLLTP